MKVYSSPRAINVFSLSFSRSDDVEVGIVGQESLIINRQM